MAHAIGCLGAPVTLSNLDTRGKKCRAKAEPRKVRNQTRRVAIVQVSRDGEPKQYRAIREGHLRHYQNAFWYAKVEYVKLPDGKKLHLKRA